MGFFGCGSKPKTERRKPPTPQIPSLDSMEGSEPASPLPPAALASTVSDIHGGDVVPPMLQQPTYKPQIEPMAPILPVAKSQARRKSPTFGSSEPTRAPAPAAGDDNWDSTDSDDEKSTNGAGRPTTGPTVTSAQAATVRGLPVEHDPSSWDSDSDEADPAVSRQGASSKDQARIPPGASQLRPDATFAPTIGCTQPNSIGGSAFDGKLRKLKCTTCGTDVLRFAGARWSDGTTGFEAVDYLFFRYYSGHSLNVHKLQERLIPDRKYAAYACQCTWQSVASLKKLSEWGTPPGAEGGTGGGSAAIRWKPVG